jgi:hypothetical protein
LIPTPAKQDFQPARLINTTPHIETMYADLWLKRVLVPAWVAQIVLNALCVVFSSVVLHFLRDIKPEDINRAINDHDITDPDLSQAELENIIRWSR